MTGEEYLWTSSIWKKRSMSQYPRQKGFLKEYKWPLDFVKQATSTGKKGLGARLLFLDRSLLSRG